MSRSLFSMFSSYSLFSLIILGLTITLHLPYKVVIQQRYCTNARAMKAAEDVAKSPNVDGRN
jgi:hypothetical protein